MEIGSSESFFEKARSKSEKQSAFMADWAVDWDFHNDTILGNDTSQAFDVEMPLT